MGGTCASATRRSPPSPRRRGRQTSIEHVVRPASRRRWSAAGAARYRRRRWRRPSGFDSLAQNAFLGMALIIHSRSRWTGCRNARVFRERCACSTVITRSGARLRCTQGALGLLALTGHGDGVRRLPFPHLGRRHARRRRRVGRAADRAAPGTLDRRRRRDRGRAGREPVRPRPHRFDRAQIRYVNSHSLIFFRLDRGRRASTAATAAAAAACSVAASTAAAARAGTRAHRTMRPPPRAPPPGRRRERRHLAARRDGVDRPLDISTPDG